MAQWKIQRLLLSSGPMFLRHAKETGWVGMNSSRILSRRFSSHTTGKPSWITKDNAFKVVSKYDTFLLDCDGVLWAADHFTKFLSTAQTMELLRNIEKTTMFVTNNSIPTRQDLMQKFTELGGFEADIRNVYSVAYVAGLYLKDIAKITGKCYLMGSEGMRDEFDSLGIDHIGYGADTDPVSLHPDDLMNHKFEDNVQAVAIGFDIHFSYNKVYKAASYLENKECHYVATNDKECNLRIAQNRRQPLTGVMVGSVNISTGRQPLVIGKPHQHLLQCVHTANPGMNLKTAIMVGDSLKTDIAFANNSGLDSILVLSGATTKEDYMKLDFADSRIPKPTYVLDSFADLYKLI